MSVPPRSRVAAAARRGQGVPVARSSYPMAQFAGASMVEGIQDSGGSEDLEDLDWMDNGGVGLMRRRVVPPTDVQSSQVLWPDGVPPAQVPIPDAADVEVADELSGAMNSGGYFTDLITNGLAPATQYDNTETGHQIAAHEEVPSSVKGNQKRSKNFTDDEDLILVSAWLNVSLDPIQGVNQSRSSYWKRMHEYFHEHNKNFVSDRSPGSLMNRWSGIQHDVSLFTSCLSRFESRNQSGVSIHDKQADALKMFKVVDKQHRNFPYMHCWKILKDQSKWKLKCKQDTQKTGSKKQKTLATSSPSSATPLPVPSNTDQSKPSNSTLQRPGGQKKEKEKLRQRSTIEALDYLMAKKKEVDVEKELKKEERFMKAFALQEERTKLLKQKIELERDQEEERIMNIDMNSLSTKQQQYYEGRQNAILARRLNT